MAFYALWNFDAYTPLLQDIASSIFKMYAM